MAMDSSHQAASSETFGRTVCPQPRKIFAPTVVKSSRLDEADAEADKELNFILTGTGPKDITQALGAHRSMSAASTCTGLTPSPDDRQPCKNVLLAKDIPALPGMSKPESPAPKHGRTSPKQKDKSKDMAQAQTRKVFVGGIPQGMTNEDFEAIFTSYGVVKKAWLQRERRPPDAPSQNSHRGFGFVVFQDDAGIDRLLGGQFQKHILTPAGRKIEVKRALATTVMQDAKAQDVSRPTSPQIPPKRSTPGIKSPALRVDTPVPSEQSSRSCTPALPDTSNSSKAQSKTPKRRSGGGNGGGFPATPLAGQLQPTAQTTAQSQHLAMLQMHQEQQRLVMQQQMQYSQQAGNAQGQSQLLASPQPGGDGNKVILMNSSAYNSPVRPACWAPVCGMSMMATMPLSAIMSQHLPPMPCGSAGCQLQPPMGWQGGIAAFQETIAQMPDHNKVGLEKVLKLAMPDHYDD